MAKEAQFYAWLKSQCWDFNLQRIETSTGAGVPDIICAYQRKGFWIELKRLSATNLQLRKEQWAWLNQNMNNGGLTSFILNKFDNYVQCWVMTPKVDVAVTRQGHVKIITEPDWIAENKQFREFLIQTINIHAT